MTVATATPSIFKLFYTHRRAEILLSAKSINVKSIERISITKPSGEFLNCVLVIYRVKNGGRCCQFVSCKEFLARATEKRKQESENYVARQNFDAPSQWRVYPKGNSVKAIEQPRQLEEGDIDKYRTVATTPQAVVCDCEDFSNQASYLSQHPYLWERLIKQNRICKHALCALNQLGFNSLSSYLKAWQPGGRLNQLSITMNRTRKSA